MKPNRVSTAELGAALELLVAALIDNPLLVHCAPERAERERFARALYRCTLRHFRRTGVVDHEPGQVVTLWGPAASVELSLLDQARCGMWRLPLQVDRKALRRLAAHERDAHRIIGPCLTDRDSFLLVMAVAPERSRQGVGKRTLDRILAAMSSRSERCLLRTERPELLAWLERDGFTITEHEAASSGLPFWVATRSLAG